MVCYLCKKNMVVKLILITIVLVAIVAFFLSLSIIFRSNGKFPNFHVGGNKQLTDKGIYCANTQDKLARKHKRAIW